MSKLFFILQCATIILLFYLSFQVFQISNAPGASGLGFSDSNRSFKPDQENTVEILALQDIDHRLQSLQLKIEHITSEFDQYVFFHGDQSPALTSAIEIELPITV